MICKLALLLYTAKVIIIFIKKAKAEAKAKVKRRKEKKSLFLRKITFGELASPVHIIHEFFR